MRWFLKIKMVWPLFIWENCDVRFTLKHCNDSNRELKRSERHIQMLIKWWKKFNGKVVIHSFSLSLFLLLLFPSLSIYARNTPYSNPSPFGRVPLKIKLTVVYIYPRRIGVLAVQYYTNRTNVNNNNYYTYAHARAVYIFEKCEGCSIPLMCVYIITILRRGSLCTPVVPTLSPCVQQMSFLFLRVTTTTTIAHRVFPHTRNVGTDRTHETILFQKTYRRFNIIIVIIIV
jgi:hypothetical protein